MRKVDREMTRLRKLLRIKIDESRLTQLEIQERCGWGGGALSQLLGGTRTFRFELLLRILEALGIKPSEFYAELYGFDLVPKGPFLFRKGSTKRGATKKRS